MIWGNRNNACLQNPSADAAILGEKAATYVEEYNEVTKKVEDSRSVLSRKWSPPIGSMLKMNVATTYFKNQKSVGLGVVIQNFRGEQMVSYCEEFPSAKDGLHSATNAMLKALQFGVDTGFYCLMVEFSLSQLKALIQSTEECLSDIGDLIAHIRNFCTKFSHLDFIVIPGSCNRVARMLAGFAKGNTEPSIWLEEGLAFLLPIVLEELS